MPANTYTRNIDALRKRDPQTAHWIDQAEADGGYRLVRNGGPLPNLAVRGRQGAWMRLYPEGNLRVLIRNKVKGQDFIQQDFSCLIGFGLGYLALAIAEKMEPGHKVMVMEPDGGILKTAFRLIDFSPLIEAGHMMFVRPKKECIQSAILNMHKKFLAGKMRIVTETPSREDAPLYAEIRDEVKRVADLKIISVDTGAFIREYFLKNMVGNIPALLHSAPVKNLEGIFRGVPAVLVSNGPSLKKNIDLLEKVKGRAVTIAVAQALRPLLAYGFEPDLITSLDPAEYNYMQVSGLFDFTKVALVYTGALDHRIPKAFQGRRFYYPYGGVIDQWLSRFCEMGDACPPGTAVVHMSLAVARLMGCDPLVFVGQDLALSDQTHMEGTDFNKTVGRLAQNNLFWVKGVKGGQVPATLKLRAQKTLLEKMIAETESRCINATEGGAHIEGTVVMSLAEVVEQYCGCQYPVQSALNRAYSPIPVNLNALVQALESKRIDLERMHRLAMEGIDLNRKLNHMVQSQDTSQALIKETMERNHQITLEIDGMGETRRQMTEFSIREHRLLSGRALNPRDDDPRIQKEAMLKRNWVFLEGIRISSGLFKQGMDRILPPLRAYRALKARLEKEAPGGLILFRLGHTLARQGFYGEALEELLKAYGLGKRDASTCLHIARCYRQMGIYKEAKLWYERVRALTSQHKEAKRCLQCLERYPDQLVDLYEYHLSRENYVHAVITALKREFHSGYSALTQEMIHRARERYKARLSSP